MIIKARETDREKLLDFLMKEPAFNLFFIGDIENEGFNSPIQDIWFRESEGGVEDILLRYRRFFIYYAAQRDLDLLPFIEILKTYPIDGLSGKSELLEGFKRHLRFGSDRTTYFARMEALRPLEDGCHGARKATLDDVPALADLRHKIQEFDTTEESIEAMADGIRSGTGEVYLLERDGTVVASAGLTAENSASAMVVGVCTDPDHRGQGYASACVEAVCRRPIEQGKFLCLFYDNPGAGRIYERLGFEPIGTWTMLNKYEPA